MTIGLQFSYADGWDCWWNLALHTNVPMTRISPAGSLSVQDVCFKLLGEFEGRINAPGPAYIELADRTWLTIELTGDECGCGKHCRGWQCGEDLSTFVVRWTQYYPVSANHYRWSVMKQVHYGPAPAFVMDGVLMHLTQKHGGPIFSTWG